MIVFRAIFAELLMPFFTTLLVMAGLLMTEKVYRLVNLVVEQRLSLGEVGRMLLYLLPQVLSITLPLAVVGAVFMTVIRQSMDSEVITLRATGRGLWNYALPFLAFGLLVSLATAGFTLWLEPLASNKYHHLQVEMVRWRAEQKLVPGRINYDFGDKVIRVGGRKSEKELRDIFISDRTMQESTPVILARSGWIEVDEAAKQVVFRLRDGEIYTRGDGGPVFRTVGFDTLRYVLDYEPARAYTPRSIRTVATARLLATVRSPDTGMVERVNSYREMQRRLAAPWAALAFALASLPMALVDPRSGKRAGYLRAIFLVGAYFVVWAAFKNLVTARKVPPEALWLPAAMILAYGALRLWQINADLESLRKVRLRRKPPRSGLRDSPRLP